MNGPTKNRGKLIVIDGIDGTGKSTQTDMLLSRFGQNGLNAHRIKFPRYETPTGKIIDGMLHGTFGDLSTISPYQQAMIFAADHSGAVKEMNAILDSGTHIISDRYATSNLGHQGSKIPGEDLDEFVKWLDCLEYEIAGIPKPDLTIILDLPVEISVALLNERAEKNGLSLDQHESDLTHLHAAHGVYQKISCMEGAVSISCAPTGKHRDDMLPPDTIHKLIWQEVAKITLPVLIT